ncbi:MAG: helix-turn-helix domain-containing protein [Patescibacteria group bacterium]|jgi:sugar-specific transcriptional regulator TrmB
MFINELKKIGLSDKEAKVYLATLELGQASVQDISKKAGVNRPTTYVILDSLIKKGLCSTYAGKDKKVRYIAESPEMIISALELEKAEIEEKQKMINDLMPQLRAIYNKQENKPVVRFFEGKEGLRTMVQEQMSSKSQLIRAFFSLDDLRKVYSAEEVNKAYQDRVASKTKTKAIFTLKEGEDRAHPSPLDERLRISADRFPINCDIAFFDNKVRIASLKDKLNGVIIEDKNIYETFVSLFELAWLGSQALPKMPSHKHHKRR